MLRLNEGLNGVSASPLAIVRDIVRKEGVTGLYHGLPATYVKLFPSTALAFAINDHLKELYSSKY